ncbi:MAG: hypothetical protein ABIJ16_13150 [Bacteroidota bacterium]
MKKKNWIFWLLAVVITLGAAYYQRKTGPTYPKKIEFTIFDSEEEFTFLTSHGGNGDCVLNFPVKDPSAQGKIWYKRYPSDDEWVAIGLNRHNDTLTGTLPHQLPAGKLAYWVELDTKFGTVNVSKEKPVIVRFKGEVPMAVLLPHVIIIFLAMFLSNLAGLFALGKRSKFRLYGFLAFFFMLAGGMILGPIMQKYAFGEFWTGVPNGWDLTDNKMLIAFIFWLFAFIVNLKKERRYAVIMAAIITIIIFSIPHSMFGSELDYSTGVVIQG